MIKFTFLIAAVLFLAAVSSGQAPNGEIEKLSAEMSALYAKGDLAAALPIAKKIVDLAEQKFGKNHLMTARALKNRGFIENADGDTKRALSSLDDAADIYKKQLGLSKADGSSYAQVLEVLGGIRLRERHPSAQETLELALNWREKSDGPDASETALAAALLASLHFWNREFKESSELYKRALLILAKTTQASSTELPSVYYRTQCAFRKAKIEDEFEPLKTTYEEHRKFNFARNEKVALIQAGVVNGKALDLKKPEYPIEARRAGASGMVSVDVLIGEDGTVLSACGAVGDQHPALVEASEISAYNSRFSPTTLQGSPVKVTGRITYRFSR